MEELINAILRDMGVALDAGQLDRLKDTLFIHMHGLQIVEEKHELMVSPDGNEAKIRMFVGSKQMAGRKEGTLQQYTREIRRLLEFTRKNVEEITTMDIRYFYAVCRRNGISLVTMQTRLHYLSSFWDFLVNEGLVNLNPIKRVGTIFVEKTIKMPYSAEDMEKIRNGCKNIRDRALVEFLYSTGVRVSELCRLNRTDIDLNSSGLKVFGKGSKERIVYLTDTAKYYLRRYLATRVDTKSALFVSSISPHTRVTKEGVEYMFHELGKRVGVSKVHPH